MATWERVAMANEVLERTSNFSSTLSSKYGIAGGRLHFLKTNQAQRDLSTYGGRFPSVSLSTSNSGTDGAVKNYNSGPDTTGNMSNVAYFYQYPYEGTWDGSDDWQGATHDENVADSTFGCWMSVPLGSTTVLNHKINIEGWIAAGDGDYVWSSNSGLAPNNNPRYMRCSIWRAYLDEYGEIGGPGASNSAKLRFNLVKILTKNVAGALDYDIQAARKPESLRYFSFKEANIPCDIAQAGLGRRCVYLVGFWIQSDDNATAGGYNNITQSVSYPIINRDFTSTTLNTVSVNVNTSITYTPAPAGS